MPINILFQTLVVCLVLQILAWLWQRKTLNADIVDITWSLSMAVASIIYYFSIHPKSYHHYIVLLAPALWYFRLSLHLYKRYNIDHEDNRYKYLRKHWNKNTQTKFFVFFVFQAILAWGFSLPAYWIMQTSFIPFSQFKIAIIIGIIALIGVSISDRQLFKFKDNPLNRNEVCDKGLWKYSRHPNYFFEWIHWLIYPILLSQTPYFYGAIAIIALMLVFLLKLTGIPFSEQQSLINRGDKYREYQSRTNKFFPWKPKKIRPRN